MELRHLRYFIAVAEELHFTRAAARLHIAQPALSQQIRELESELGVSLLTRSKRHIALTDAGRAFLERARVVLDDVATARQSAHLAARGELNRIAIGFAALIGSDLLSKTIRAQKRRHPNVEIALEPMDAAAQLKGIFDGELDMGLLERPVAHTQLRCDLVGREPLGVVLPAHHRLAQRKAVALGDLAEEPFILPPEERMTPILTKLLTACADIGFSPRIAQHAPIHAAFVLVASGVGVYVTAARHWVHYADDVVVRPLRDPSLHVDYFAVRRVDRDSPQLAELVEALRQYGGIGEKRRPTVLPTAVG